MNNHDALLKEISKQTSVMGGFEDPPQAGCSPRGFAILFPLSHGSPPPFFSAQERNPFLHLEVTSFGRAIQNFQAGQEF